MQTKDNPQLQLAYQFVQFTGTHIFLTGKAGTGKTTFLRELKKMSPKRMVVVAPTGVAAINAGGVTIHSFFQLSFGPQVPGYDHEAGNASFKKFSREKQNIIKSLDLLVIDEISMVRADVLDGIDGILRRFKNSKLPFGGVQLLMIGDLQQLAPVVKQDEWQVLRQYYHTAFFFGSKALQETKFVSIELKHVYRQSDPAFIGLLNKVRDNQIDRQVVEVLNSRYKPNFSSDGDGYITLTTHNNKAQQINESRLNKLQSKSRSFYAEVVGNFPEHNYPTDEKLVLKEGAQVMFVKNDPSVDKLFYNGKIGKVIDFEEDTVIVDCEGDQQPIEVKALEWQNVKYRLDLDTKEISEEVEGSFVQIPLRLAWAMTIHKSQGLTFEKAVIDAQAAFAHGQVYVALSRCKSLEGMVLSSRIGSESVHGDPGIRKFTENVEANQPDREHLEAHRREYTGNLIYDLFDFSSLQQLFHKLNEQLIKNTYNLQVELVNGFQDQLKDFRKSTVNVAGNFRRQIEKLMPQDESAEQNPLLQERIKKAGNYFEQQLQKLIDKINSTEVETDNKEIRKSINAALDNLNKEAFFKQRCLLACKNGFVMKDYLQEKAKASLEEPPKKRKKKDAYTDPGNISDTALYDLLKSWRNAKVRELGWEYFMILPLKTMREMCDKIPSTRRELSEIKGFGKKKLEFFGDELLELLNEYREAHDMEVKPPEDPVNKVKKPKVDTRKITFDLWKSGKNIEEIARERKFAVATIEGHLARYVENGELPLDEILSKEKIKRISDHFRESGSVSLGRAKADLGEDISYGEIKLVLSHLKQEAGDSD